VPDVCTGMLARQNPGLGLSIVRCFPGNARGFGARRSRSHVVTMRLVITNAMAPAPADGAPSREKVLSASCSDQNNQAIAAYGRPPPPKVRLPVTGTQAGPVGSSPRRHWHAPPQAHYHKDDPER
jgi:hypothetical protein